MRSAKEQEATTGAISLGLLATRLQLSLLRGEGAVFQDGENLLARWEDILEETIAFIESPQDQRIDIAGRANLVSPHFLARAHYLGQLRSAAPLSTKTMEGLAQYLQKIRDSIRNLREGRSLSGPQRRTLLSFASSTSQSCVQETSRAQREPHPKWHSQSALAFGQQHAHTG